MYYYKEIRLLQSLTIHKLKLLIEYSYNTKTISFFFVTTKCYNISSIKEISACESLS